MESLLPIQQHQEGAGCLRSSRLALVRPDGSSRTDDPSSEVATLAPPRPLLPPLGSSSTIMFGSRSRRQQQQQQQPPPSVTAHHRGKRKDLDDVDDKDTDTEDHIPTFEHPLHADLQGTPALYYRGPLTSEQVLQLITQTTPTPISRQARNALTPSNSSVTTPPIGSPWAWFHFSGLFPRPIAHRKGPKRRRLHDSKASRDHNQGQQRDDDDDDDEQQPPPQESESNVLFERWQCKNCKTNCHVLPKRYSNLSAHLYGHARQVGCLSKKNRRRWVPGACPVERLPRWTEHDRKAVQDAEMARAQLLTEQIARAATSSSPWSGKEQQQQQQQQGKKRKGKVGINLVSATRRPAAYKSEGDEEFGAGPGLAGPSASSSSSSLSSRSITSTRLGYRRACTQLTNKDQPQAQPQDQHTHSQGVVSDGQADARRRPDSDTRTTDQRPLGPAPVHAMTSPIPIQTSDPPRSTHGIVGGSAAATCLHSPRPSPLCLSSDSPWSSENEYAPSHKLMMRSISVTAAAAAVAAEEAAHQDRTRLSHGGRAVSRDARGDEDDQEEGELEARVVDDHDDDAFTTTDGTSRGVANPSQQLLPRAISNQKQHSDGEKLGSGGASPPSGSGATLRRSTSAGAAAAAAPPSAAQGMISAIPSRRRLPALSSLPISRHVASNPCFVLASALQPDYPILASSSPFAAAAADSVSEEEEMVGQERKGFSALEVICGYAPLPPGSPAAAADGDEARESAVIGMGLVDLLAVEDMILADKMVEDVLSSAQLGDANGRGTHGDDADADAARPVLAAVEQGGKSTGEDSADAGVCVGSDGERGAAVVTMDEKSEHRTELLEVPLHLPHQWEQTSCPHPVNVVHRQLRFRHAHGYFLPFFVRLHLVPLVTSSAASLASTFSKEREGKIADAGNSPSRVRFDAASVQVGSSSGQPSVVHHRHRHCFALVWTFLLAGNPGARMPPLVVALPSALGRSQAKDVNADDEEVREEQDRERQKRHVEVLKGAAAAGSGAC